MRLSTPIAERRRLLLSSVVGIAVGAASALATGWPLATLVGWDATATLLVSWIWVNVARMDADATREFATREDSSRGSTRVLLLLASSTSLGGVMFALVRASQSVGLTKVGFTAAGIATIVTSWSLVHTLYALRYAHLYYGDVPGGVDFKNDDEPPAYLDFAYLAFTVGMTFQVSDTDIQSTTIRRTVLRQALLSYVFGTVIVATAINVVAGLFK